MIDRIMSDEEVAGVQAMAKQFDCNPQAILSMFRGEAGILVAAMYALREAYTALVILKSEAGIEWKPNTWNEFEGIPGHALVALEESLDAIPFVIDMPNVNNTADDIIGDVLKWSDDHGSMPSSIRSRMVAYQNRRR